MNLELLQVGTKVKYATLCEAFGVEKKTGKSKQLQMKEFERYINMEKEGTWFNIIEIYSEPKEKVDGRGKSEGSQKALRENRYVQPRKQYTVRIQEGYAEVDIPQGDKIYTTLIDTEDLDRFLEKGWGVTSARYIKSYDENKFLHRCLMGLENLNDKHYSEDRVVVHHINHNPLDNRKCNLQIMTEREHLKLHSNDGEGRFRRHKNSEDNISAHIKKNRQRLKLGLTYFAY